MPRVKRGTKARRRRNKVLKMAKGYRHGRRRLYKSARETVFRALSFAYRDRRVRKRDFRRLWIQRINAGARRCGLSYSRMIHGLKLAEIEIDRKVLADLAVSDFDSFSKIADTCKEVLSSQTAGA
jgi:large subunit ribosomal protein L20